MPNFGKIGQSVAEILRRFGFYRAMHYSAKRGLAIAYHLSYMSVCLPVRLPVTT